MKMISYAQNYEDVILRRALGAVEKGFYVDVGANDPVEHSVTKAFYDAGWRGINIEPVPQWFARLEHQRPEDINLKLAAGAEKGFITFYDIPDTGLSTQDISLVERHRAERGFDTIIRQVELETLNSILEQYQNGDIHFLKIDVEGAEKDVLRGLDLSRFRPWIVVVESTLPLSQQENFEDWEALILDFDYQMVYFDGLNRFYLAAEHRDLGSAFIVPPNVFDDFITLSQWQDRSAYGDLKVAYERLESELERLGSESTELEERLSISLADGDVLRQHCEKEAQTWKIQALEAENRAKAAELECAEYRIKLLEAASGRRDTEQALQAAQQNSHHWWLQATQAQEHLALVLGSTSWRLSEPIRALVELMRTSRSVKVVGKRLIYRPTVSLLRAVITHKGATRFALRALNSFPELKARLRAVASREGLIEDALEGEAVPVLQADQDALDVSQLPRVAREIYIKLKNKTPEVQA